MGNHLRDPAAQRLQGHNRHTAGDKRGQQRIEDQLNGTGQNGAQLFLNPAHQDDHQQHRNHPAAPGLESLAKQGYLRKLRAGENTGHHPAHRH